MSKMFKVDPEFAALAPPESQWKLKQWRRWTQNTPNSDRVIVWLEKGIVLRRHELFLLCHELHRDYQVLMLTFPTRAAALEWARKHQPRTRQPAVCGKERNHA